MFKYMKKYVSEIIIKIKAKKIVRLYLVFFRGRGVKFRSQTWDNLGLILKPTGSRVYLVNTSESGSNSEFSTSIFFCSDSNENFTKLLLHDSKKKSEICIHFEEIFSSQNNFFYKRIFL